MTSRLPILVSLMFVLVASACAKPEQAAPTATAKTDTQASVPVPAPEKLIADLYDQHARQQSPFFQTTNRELVDRYFEPALADLIWKDAVAASGEVGAIDFDPLYDAQDTDIKNLVIQPATTEGANARVVVSFENMGSKVQIPYTLVRSGDAWKISDITYPETTLRTLLTAAAPQS